MFETPTTTAHRDAIARAHAERAAAFAVGLAWIKAQIHFPRFGAPAASGH